MDENRHASFVLVHKAFFGGMITSANAAIGMANAVLEGLHGEEERRNQQPLSAKDEGDSWLVEGRYQDPELEPGDGGWWIRILKDDARVLGTGHRIKDLEFTPEAKEMIRRARAKNKSDVGGGG